MNQSMPQGTLVPAWVYSFADYCQMFDLAESDFSKQILDFPAGISSFNAEMHAKGHKVVSGDYSYSLSEQKMAQHADDIYETDKQHLLTHQELLLGDHEKAVDHILHDWQQSKQLFLQDYHTGLDEQRYQAMKLPSLPFDDHSFQLALCSDFLFHSKACEHCNPQELIGEMCRIAEEVRVFPLLDEHGQMPESLGPILVHLQTNNYGVEIREVAYELQKGGNAMLRIWAQECVV